ncbi:hypothetical protein B0H13DRAFT_1896473 [Mycena leptocephala]|nr:hypothetical protein B0H13DRAFT_1896473 [Mycena leptocephala]
MAVAGWDLFRKAAHSKWGEGLMKKWLEVTNDGNESERGIIRLSSRALRMYKANNTSKYVVILNAEDRQAIRAQVRVADAQSWALMQTGNLVYIDRGKPHLQISRPDWIHHRVFLGALVLASKYNARVFDTRDIGIMERDFLSVLDYELWVKEYDIMAHHASFMVQGLDCRTRRKVGHLCIRGMPSKGRKGEELPDVRDKKRSRIK